MTNVERIILKKTNDDEFGDDDIARRADKLAKGGVRRSHHIADIAENLVAVINKESKSEVDGIEQPAGERDALQNLILSMEPIDDFDALYQMIVTIHEISEIAESIPNQTHKDSLNKLIRILGKDYEVLRDSISRCELMNIVANHLIGDRITKKNCFNGETF